MIYIILWLHIITPRCLNPRIYSKHIHSFPVVGFNFSERGDHWLHDIHQLYNSSQWVTVNEFCIYVKDSVDSLLHRSRRLRRIARHFFPNLINYFKFHFCQSKRLFLYHLSNATNYCLPFVFFTNIGVIHWSFNKWLSWSCSYCSWIYNYLCNQCLSPRTLWVRIPRCTRYNIMW